MRIIFLTLLLFFLLALWALVRFFTKQAREEARAAEKVQRERRKRWAAEEAAREQAQAQQRAVAQAVDAARRQRVDIAASIDNLRVKRIGDSITIYRCRCFFLRVEVDPLAQTVAFDWRFDLWKGAEHRVSMWQLYRSKDDIDMQERYRAWEIFQKNGRRLPVSEFRKDRRVVHAVTAGRPCDFFVIAKVPGHEREFTVEVFMPPEAAKERERELEESQQLVVQGTILQRYKAENDEDANEIREYIAEVEARTDLSEDEKDDEIDEWETILGKRRMDRMQKYFQIGITEGL